MVRGLSAADSWLEGKQLLPELKPLEVPEEVRDEIGGLNGECKEVRRFYFYQETSMPNLDASSGVTAADDHPLLLIVP